MDTTARRTILLYAISALFGIIGGLLTILTIAMLDSLISLIWEKGIGISTNNPSHTLASLLVLIIFGLGIGLFSKKFGPAKGSIETVVVQSLESGSINWKSAYKNVFISLISIGSGASLGPEAPSAMLTAGTASLLSEKAKLRADTTKALNLSAVSGMLGTILSSPFVASAMFIESAKVHIGQLRLTISYSLIAGSFGMATFFFLYGKLYAMNFGIPAYSGPNMEDLLKAFGFGLIGALFAVIVGVFMLRIEPLFKKLDTKLVVRGLVGATFVGIIAFFLPLTMFSGQHTMPTLVNEAGTASIVFLLLLAVGKILSTTVLIRSGFFGGPIFPALFSGAALGIALNGLFNAPLAVAIAATAAGIITVSLRQPLTSAFIVIAITGTSTIAPVALAVCAGLVVVSLIEQKQAKTTA